MGVLVRRALLFGSVFGPLSFNQEGPDTVLLGNQAPQSIVDMAACPNQKAPSTSIGGVIYKVSTPKQITIRTKETEQHNPLGKAERPWAVKGPRRKRYLFFLLLAVVVAAATIL